MRGGKLSLAMEFGGWGFDIIKARGLFGASRVASHLIMERLFELDENGALIPVLGLSATPSKDGLSWTVTLRKGVKFHDGSDFKADAVVAHWKRILDPKNKVGGRYYFAPIENVESKDDYTVIFHLNKPWTLFTQALASTRSFPPLIPALAISATDDAGQTAIGTGPFKLKEWVPRDKIVLVRNENYRQSGLPYLDEIVIKIARDPETRRAALVSGQMDVIVTDRPKHIEELSTMKGITTNIGESGGGIILPLNTTRPPFDDVRARRALAHAWNPELYVRVGANNYVPALKNWFGNTLSCEDSGFRGYDVDKAKELLAQYGKPVKFEYLHTQSTRGREAGQILQQMFAEVGIEMTPTPLDWGGIVKRSFSGDYNMASKIIQSEESMALGTSVYLHSKGPQNIAQYESPEMDKLIDRMSAAKDSSTRDDLLCEIMRKANDDVPLLLMYGLKYYVFTKDKVKGLKPPRTELMNLHQVWIEK